MVVVSQPALDHFSPIKTCRPNPTFFTGIPVVDLSGSDQGSACATVVKACKDFGFFKVVNHGVPTELIAELESLAQKFFSLPQSEKDRAGPPDPFGYGSKRIGPNGDVGWVEYLLFNANPDVLSRKTLPILDHNPDIFRSAFEKYMTAVKEMTYKIAEMMAEGLGVTPRDAISRYLRHENSDSCFRLNHYPPCPELQALSGRSLIGFGEHTDPQIMSVLRSNNTCGLQISLADGTWVSVPSDQSAFFINVGDSLQVMTNGRFKSLKHRVFADPMKSRLSMIFFGGPAMSEKIAPLPCLVGEGEESFYKEFTWCEYKKSAYKSRLADYRLGLFEKKNIKASSNSNHLQQQLVPQN